MPCIPNKAPPNVAIATQIRNRPRAMTRAGGRGRTGPSDGAMDPAMRSSSAGSTSWGVRTACFRISSISLSLTEDPFALSYAAQPFPQTLVSPMRLLFHRPHARRSGARHLLQRHSRHLQHLDHLALALRKVGQNRFQVRILVPPLRAVLPPAQAFSQAALRAPPCDTPYGSGPRECAGQLRRPTPAPVRRRGRCAAPGECAARFPVAGRRHPRGWRVEPRRTGAVAGSVGGSGLWPQRNHPAGNGPSAFPSRCPGTYGEESAHLIITRIPRPYKDDSLARVGKLRRRLAASTVTFSSPAANTLATTKCSALERTQTTQGENDNA